MTMAHFFVLVLLITVISKIQSVTGVLPGQRYQLIRFR